MDEDKRAKVISMFKEMAASNERTSVKVRKRQPRQGGTTINNSTIVVCGPIGSIEHVIAQLLGKKQSASNQE